MLLQLRSNQTIIFKAQRTLPEGKEGKGWNNNRVEIFLQCCYFATLFLESTLVVHAEPFLSKDYPVNFATALTAQLRTWEAELQWLTPEAVEGMIEVAAHAALASSHTGTITITQNKAEGDGETTTTIKVSNSQLTLTSAQVEALRNALMLWNSDGSPHTIDA